MRSFDTQQFGPFNRPPAKLDHRRGHQHQRDAKQRPVELSRQDIANHIYSLVRNADGVSHEHVERERHSHEVQRPSAPFQKRWSRRMLELAGQRAPNNHEQRNQHR